MLNVKSEASRSNRTIRNVVTLGSLLAAVLLSACTTVGPMAMSRDADREMACVAVQWTPHDKIASICGRDNVYGLPNQACLVDGYRIVSSKPKDWNDETAMISLGHELYHALGAMHN
jgi:hypothetical protein